MILHDDGEKLNFIVGVHVSDPFTGGIVSLHMLAYKLAQREHNVYIFCDPLYPHKNIKKINSSPSKYINGINTVFQWEKIQFPYRNTISIYPEITKENTYKTKHVCRWILYHTEEFIEKTYGSDDVYFNFGTFLTFDKKDNTKKLTAIDYKFNDLYIENTTERKGFCHIFHKNTPEGADEFVSRFNSTNLKDWRSKGEGEYDYLRKEFNKYEYFLTYDQKTFLSIAAVLCGCKVIILRDDKIKELRENAFTRSEYYNNIISPTEYRLNNPLMMFGIAYGIDDIQWANKTIGFARDHLKELQKIDDKTVDQFIEYWYKKTS
jgi:hypothetical protein